jgi:hypothetical protein
MLASTHRDFSAEKPTREKKISTGDIAINASLSQLLSTKIWNASCLYPRPRSVMINMSVNETCNALKTLTERCSGNNSPASLSISVSSTGGVFSVSEPCSVSVASPAFHTLFMSSSSIAVARSTTLVGSSSHTTRRDSAARKAAFWFFRAFGRSSTHGRTCMRRPLPRGTSVASGDHSTNV